MKTAAIILVIGSWLFALRCLQSRLTLVWAWPSYIFAVAFTILAGAVMKWIT